MRGNGNFVDQMGRTVVLETIARRVLSIVPSQTELLFYLGLEDKIVGLTKFCVHPTSARREKVVVGGTKNLHLDKIVALKPDLVIGNKEENTQELIHHLSQICPIWMSDIHSLTSAQEMIAEMGNFFDVESKSQRLIDELRDEFDSFQKLNKLRVLYFIWRDPYMVAGSGTFIDHMLNTIGLENAAFNLSRYPLLEIDEIRSLAPEVIMLSSEPYPFKTKHIAELEKEFPDTQIMIVNGEYFSWYGSRLLKAPAYFKTLNFV